MLGLSSFFNASPTLLMVSRPFSVPLMAAALSLTLGAGAVHAQATQIAPGDWGVQCGAPGCVVTTMVADEANNRLLSLTFALGRGGGPIRVALLTPLGTALNQGLRLRAGVLDQTYRFTTCTPEGCAVLLDLPQPDVANLAVQPSLRASFYAVNSKEPYEIVVDLSEMAEALDAAEAEMAK